MKIRDKNSGKFVSVDRLERVCANCGKIDLVVPYYKDRPYCSRSCSNSAKGAKYSGSKHPNWKGGKTLQHGYIVLSGYHGHPMATAKGKILEHRLVMAEHIGRYLVGGEDVHHINGVKTDNRIKNLELLSHRDHISKDNAQKGKKYWGINQHLS